MSDVKWCLVDKSSLINPEKKQQYKKEHIFVCCYLTLLFIYTQLKNTLYYPRWKYMLAYIVFKPKHTLTVSIQHSHPSKTLSMKGQVHKESWDSLGCKAPICWTLSCLGKEGHISTLLGPWSTNASFKGCHPWIGVLIKRSDFQTAQIKSFHLCVCASLRNRQ